MDVNTLIASTIGLIGVLYSIYSSKKLNKENNIFQEKLNKENNNFSENLNEKNRENELWDKKFDITIQLIGNRDDLSRKEFKQAINSISVLFHDSPKVLDKLDSFYIEASKNHSDPTRNNNEKILDLLESMLENLDIRNTGDRSRLFKLFHTN